MSRIQVPFGFSYPSGTVYVAGSSGGSPTTQGNLLEPVVGATVTITNRDTLSPATVYQAETGVTTLGSIVTDTGGNVPGWLDPGSYKVTVAAQGAFAGASLSFEAVRGDAVTNLANGSVGANQIQNGVITLAHLSSALQQSLVPTGTAFYFVGSTAPTGYALLDGTGHQPSDGNWATYSPLFGVVGTTYGTFGTGGYKLPDARGRVAIAAGQGTGLTNRLRGATVGVETYSLTSGELAVHNHGLSDPGHAHGVHDPGHLHTLYGGGGSAAVFDNGGVLWISPALSGTGGLWIPSTGGYHASGAEQTDSAGTGLTVSSGTTGITVQNAGSGTAHQNMQPSLVFNMIVKL